MCNDCFNKDLKYRFETQKEFEDFETIIQNECTNKKLEIIKREDTDYFAPFDTFEFYKCNSCGQIWTLSIPENAWRGFFLTETEAIRHSRELRKKDRVKGLVGLLIIFVVIVTIIWNWIN